MTAVPGTWPTSRSRALDWLVHETTGEPFADLVFGEVCRRLVEDGLAIDRATFALRTLHPQFLGGLFLWEPGYEEAAVNLYSHDAMRNQRYLESPVRAIFDGEVAGIRRRLDRPEEEGPNYPIYDDLREAGHVDYVMMAVPCVSGNINAAAFSTRRAGGFTTGELTTIADILPVLGMAVELRSNRRIAKNLLNAYVGSHAGERILAGDIRRGSGETVRAAIWHCDMRGFTLLSESWPRDDVIGCLNAYFDAMASPVLEHGGDILKFLGDGMLAVFPLEEPRACERALQAALEARRAMRAINEARREEQQPEIGFGIVLHAGDVMWGNIGAATRLDFTVIGPAVNVASRLDGLTKELRRDILLSGDFASLCEGARVRLVHVGAYRLRGVEREIDVFGLPEDFGSLPAPRPA
ncbi:MAG: adenylate/guanylate cyclase domain-containing protein [Geminicoccaceae bacterium]|nr:adenylate/guanylate cyclase domain-containing protein [Geminicoccaceae bacterium]